MRQRPPIGLVVEGESEYAALPYLVARGGGRNANPIIFGGQAVNSDLERFAAQRIGPKVRAAMLKRVAKVVVVVDRELRPDCPSKIARTVAAGVSRYLDENFPSSRNSPPFVVVCADRSLENWLIADPEKIAAYGNLQRRPVRPRTANVDGKDACRLIRRACKPNRSYHKTRDAPQLARLVRVDEPTVRRRSKSLDKFLRESVIT